MQIKKVAILGSGNIGCDLLVKCLKEENLEVVSFSGRHASSKGLNFARSLGVPTSDRSIDGIINDFDKPEILIDATSARHHPINYKIAKKYGIKIIDMTPAKLGISCCPVVNLKSCLKDDNINMISCGGQAAMPLIYAIKKENQNLNYVEAVSTISSASAGPATRKNISEYITSTEKAISQLLKIKDVKVMLNITPALPPIEMKTSILLRTKDLDNIDKTWDQIQIISKEARKYISGYKNTLSLKSVGSKSICQIKVHGSGDYLPKYAGNLDIINCAAIEVIRNL
ncbi:acetaldehyde dehydrogenase (acetylating) [Prochlorococcus sp. AH-716-M10]|nr:acetaldehyde dehydrogenase (acetylating) [Prochlorococcus sp. AH-716-M10]